MSNSELLSLFKSTYGRQPINSNEFVSFCTLVKNNNQTLNSRRLC